MKSYMIGAFNSSGFMHNYVSDDDNKLSITGDLEGAKAYLELLQLDSEYWADHRVIELVEVK